MENIRSTDRWQNLKVFLFYSLLVWIVWYFKLFQFGYYEDDYWYSVIPSNMGFRELLGDIRDKLISFEGNQGRFIGFTVPFFLTHVIYHIGGLPVLYIFGIFLVAFNAYLFYSVIGRLGEWWFGLFAGLVFIVYPADTTKALIVHIYQLQLSLMFTLLAFHFYESRRLLSYLLALASLLTYENAFLAFVFVPFLRMNLFKAATLRKWSLHALVCLLFMLFVFLVRKFTGEARVSELGADTIRKVLLSFIIGPLVSLYAYFKAAIESLQHLRTTWPMISAIFILLAVVLAFMRKRIKPDGLTFGRAGWLLEWNKFPKSYLYLCIVGLLMMSVGYLFAFTHYPPRFLAGRGTSVHLGATFGSVLFFVSAWLYLFSVVRGKRIRYALAVILTGWISLIGSRGLLVQNDLATSWEFQKSLYHQVFALASDMDEGDLILLEDQNPVMTKYIDPYGWQIADIPELLIEFPPDFEAPPRIILARSEPGSFFTVHDSGVFFIPPLPFLYDFQDTVYIHSNDLIYLKRMDGELVRVDEDRFFEENGIALKRKWDPDQVLNYDKKLVYKDFDLNSDSH